MVKKSRKTNKLERFPIRWNHLMVKKSRETNKLGPHFGSTKMKAGLERDAISLNRHHALNMCGRMILRQKPVIPFCHHALILILLTMSACTPSSNDRQNGGLNAEDASTLDAAADKLDGQAVAPTATKNTASNPK